MATPPTGEDPLDAAPPLTRTVVRGASVASIGYAAAIAIQFVTYLVLARLISPANFGRYAAGGVVTGIGGLFAESGMLAALIRQRDRFDEYTSTAFFSLLISGTLLTMVSLALAPLMGFFFHSGEVGAITAVMSGWLLLHAIIIVPSAILQRRFSFLRRVIVDPLGAAAFAAGSIPLAVLGAGAWALVAGSYASMVLETGSAWWFARFVPRLRLVSFWRWRELAAFARPVLLAETLRRVSSQFDTIMLGHFAGAAPLGQYRNGLRLADQPQSAFVSVTAYVLYPAFARIGRIPNRISAAARHTYWVSMTVVIPVSAAAIPLGVPLALILLGPQWRPAGHAIAALAGTVIAGAIISIASELFKSIGRPGVLIGMQLILFIGVASTVTVGAIVWGLVGVAIAMSVSGLVTAAYALVRVCTLVDISWRDAASWFAGPAVAAAFMVAGMLAYAGALNPLRHPSDLQILLTLGEVVAGAAVYLIVLGAIDGPRRRELQRLLVRRSGKSGRGLEGPGLEPH